MDEDDVEDTSESDEELLGITGKGIKKEDGTVQSPSITPTSQLTLSKPANETKKGKGKRKRKAEEQPASPPLKKIKSEPVDPIALAAAASDAAGT